MHAINTFTVMVLQIKQSHDYCWKSNYAIVIHS